MKNQSKTEKDMLRMRNRLFLGGQDPQVQAVAPNPDASMMYEVARALAELGLGGDNIGIRGDINGGITDYRLGNNHGGPRPEAVNVIQGALLNLDNEQKTLLRIQLGNNLVNRVRTYFDNNVDLGEDEVNDHVVVP